MGDLSVMSIDTKLSGRHADSHPTPLRSNRRLLRATWAIPLSGLLLWAASSPAAGQEIRGVVRARGVGIGVAAADVRLLDRHDSLKAERRSDDHGSFVFRHLSPGRYSIRAEAPGFARAAEAEVLVRGSRVVNVTVWLEPRPITIPRLEVEARRRGDAFIHQRLGVSVQSLNPVDVTLGARMEELKVGSFSLSDMLHKTAIPGLVVTKLFGSPCFQLRGAVDLQGRPICATVYLDGLRVDRDKLWSIQVEDIGAIVMLDPDEAGVLYGTRSGSGVVLVYTREAMQEAPGGGGRDLQRRRSREAR